mgnify:CR=1 FL=1
MELVAIRQKSRIWMRDFCLILVSRGFRHLPIFHLPIFHASLPVKRFPST